MDTPAADPSPVDASLPEIRAARLVIPDAAGTPRLVLELDDEGEPAVRLFDRNGEERAFLALSESAQGFLLAAQPTTTAHLRLTASDDGTAIDLVADPGGSGRIEMGNDPEDAAYVIFEVDRPQGGRQAYLVIRDHNARIEFQVRDGEAKVATAAG